MKIKSGNYHTLSLGNYEKIKEGNEIYFCGYPLLSWHHAINHGMVSALFTHDSIKIIQIGGSVNSGNSGGPLLDMNDKVVGVVTQKEGRVDDNLMKVSDNLVNTYRGIMINLGHRASRIYIKDKTTAPKF